MWAPLCALFPSTPGCRQGTVLLLTWLPALMTAGVSSGLASLISSGSVPAIPIQAGSVQRAWMSVPCTSRHGSGVPVSGMWDRDALAACWEQHGHIHTKEEALLKRAVLPGGSPSVSVLAWIIQKSPKGDWEWENSNKLSWSVPAVQQSQESLLKPNYFLLSKGDCQFVAKATNKLQWKCYLSVSFKIKPLCFAWLHLDKWPDWFYS